MPAKRLANSRGSIRRLEYLKAQFWRGAPRQHGTKATIGRRQTLLSLAPNRAGLAGRARHDQNWPVPAEELVGRRLITGTLRSAVDAATAGAGGVVLLTGEAGMGKTALASEAVAYAKARGALAVWGTCWDGDGAPGFWPWIQVMRGLAGDGDD